MRRLVTNPYAHKETIQKEQRVIKLMMEDSEFMSSAKEMLSKLPDLERFISKFGTLSKGIRPDDHPDTRAVMYEEILYSRQKTQKFCYVLDSFHNIATWLKKLSSKGVDQALVDELKESMPDMDDLLTEWRQNFDSKKAKEDGTLVPKAGTNPPYDEALEKICQTKNEAEELRRECEQRYGSAKLMKSGKLHFLVQIPDSKKVPSNWAVKGSKKGYKNYLSPDLEVLNETLERFLKQKDFALKASSSVVFERFFADAAKWRHIVQVINRLDVRLALAKYSVRFPIQYIVKFIERIICHCSL